MSVTIDDASFVKLFQGLVHLLDKMRESDEKLAAITGFLSQQEPEPEKEEPDGESGE